MALKESWVALRQKVDTWISDLTRNKIKEEKFGSMTLLIHERKRGRWVKIASPNAAFPLRGKEHDIVYSVSDEGQLERRRLGQMAKEQQVGRGNYLTVAEGKIM